ncbi:MAG TPA: HNH endonuclease, partial [Ilumatobacteraceae bacterium]|nr:HNH endonuclease [Ilumatobacteraceae bacterium]
MEIAGVIERVERIASVRTNPAAAVDLIESGLVAVREVQAWCDAQHAGLVEQLGRVDSFPEQRIAKASKKSLGQAAKTTERS